MEYGLPPSLHLFALVYYELLKNADTKQNVYGFTDDFLPPKSTALKRPLSGIPNISLKELTCCMIALYSQS